MEGLSRASENARVAIGALPTKLPEQLAEQTASMRRLAPLLAEMAPKVDSRLCAAIARGFGRAADGWR